MKKSLRYLSLLLAVLALCGFLSGCLGTASDAPQDTAEEAEELLPEDGTYTAPEELALYIHQYGRLPDNFMTKKEAREAGWDSTVSLESVAPGMCIGGDVFKNREGLLPRAEGRTWTECDVNTLGQRYRGPERIVFSNDGLIYYTADHYDSFTLMYGNN